MDVNASTPGLRADGVRPRGSWSGEVLDPMSQLRKAASQLTQRRSFCSAWLRNRSTCSSMSRSIVSARSCSFAFGCQVSGSEVSRARTLLGSCVSCGSWCHSWHWPPRFDRLAPPDVDLWPWLGSIWALDPHVSELALAIRPPLSTFARCAVWSPSLSSISLRDVPVADDRTDPSAAWRSCRSTAVRSWSSA